MLTANSLIDLGLINHPDAEHYLSLYFTQCNESKFAELSFSDIPIVGFVNQISQILIPVAAGLGFTVLLKSAVDSFDLIDDIIIFQPKQKVEETLYQVTKKKRALPARFEIINTVIGEHFKS